LEIEKGAFDVGYQVVKQNYIMKIAIGLVGKMLGWNHNVAGSKGTI